MRIKVIIRDGIIEAVLTDAPAEQLPDVEIVDINGDYEDYKQLKERADELYADKSLHETAFSVTHFDDNNE